MEYKPNGKGIMTPVEDILMVYSPNGKDVLWKIVFRSAIVKVLDKKKMQHKRYNVNQNKFFLHYMKRTRVIVMLPVVFKESEEVYIIFATFFFYSLSIG